MEISNQIGRRSPRNTIPTTSKLYKTNGKALRNSNRKCSTDVQKYPVTNNSKG